MFRLIGYPAAPRCITSPAPPSAYISSPPYFMLSSCHYLLNKLARYFSVLGICTRTTRQAHRFFHFYILFFEYSLKRGRWTCCRFSVARFLVQRNCGRRSTPQSRPLFRRSMQKKRSKARARQTVMCGRRSGNFSRSRGSWVLIMSSTFHPSALIIIFFTLSDVSSPGHEPEPPDAGVQGVQAKNPLMRITLVVPGLAHT